jgi:hypothetical protein
MKEITCIHMRRKRHKSTPASSVRDALRRADIRRALSTSPLPRERESESVRESARARASERASERERERERERRTER